MKNIIQLSLVCTGFVVAMPLMANALDLQKVGQNPQVETNVQIAQYRRNQDRQFSVYYRSSRQQQWTLHGYHATRRDAEIASNRLQRRGYRTYVQVSRRIYDGMGRNR
jgi:hypothetical protein